MDFSFSDMYVFLITKCGVLFYVSTQLEHRITRYLLCIISVCICEDIARENYHLNLENWMEQVAHHSVGV